MQDIRQAGNEMAEAGTTRLAELKVVEITVGVYKHHWDLFLRAYSFYLVACSILAGFLFADKCLEWEDAAISAVLFAASLVASVASLIAGHSIEKTARAMEPLLAPYGIQPIDARGTGRIIWVFALIAMLFAVFGALSAANAYLNFGTGCAAGSVVERNTNWPQQMLQWFGL